MYMNMSSLFQSISAVFAYYAQVGMTMKFLYNTTKIYKAQSRRDKGRYNWSRDKGRYNWSTFRVLLSFEQVIVFQKLSFSEELLYGKCYIIA